MKQITSILLVGLLASCLLADHHEQGFHSLFDGKTLKGWEGKSEFWSVEDGAITGRTTKENPTKGNTFIIWRGGTVDDFELRLKFRIVGHNSGIQYRSKELDNFVVSGYQADFEAGDKFSGILYEEQGRGILAERGQMTRVTTVDGKKNVEVIASLGDTKLINQVIKKEDWNDYKIIAKGNFLMHVINGRATVQVVDEGEQAAKSGILAFQLHQGPPMVVQFKDVRLRPMNGIALTGKWNFEVDVNGNVGTPSFVFKNVDGKLKGEYEGAFGEAKVTGSQKGNVVRWSFVGDYNGNDVECDYEGEFVSPTRMKGIVTMNGGDFQATWTATRGQ